MRDHHPPPDADGHVMEFTPDTDEAPLPEPGRDVWIEGTEHGPLPVSVLEHAVGGLLALEPPRIDGAPVGLGEGCRVRIDYRLQGVPCAFRAETVAPGARRADRLWIRRTGPTMRFQRRSDFRIRDALTARLWPVAGDAAGQAPPLVGVTENLSTAGALLRSAPGVQPGCATRLELDMPGGDRLELPAVVVRVVDPERATGERQIALAFTGVLDDDERRLGEHVTAHQRRALREGREGR